MPVVALAAVGNGCRIQAQVHVKPGTAPRCDQGICVEIVSATVNRPTIGMWIDAPLGTFLANARVAKAGDPLCGAGHAVEWVTVDHTVFRTGPADVGGSHGLVLNFPHDIWHVNQGENFVELDLLVAGAHRCARARLTGPDSKFAVGS